MHSAAQQFASKIGTAIELGTPGEEPDDTRDAMRNPQIVATVRIFASLGRVHLKAWAHGANFTGDPLGPGYVAEFVGRSDDELAAQSPIHHLDKPKAPVLIVHCEDDKSVPFSQATMLRATLDKLGKPHEWLSKLHEGHGFRLVENRVAMYEKLQAFLDQHIGALPQAAAGH